MRQASISARASAKLANQCSLRHSSRNLTLKLSTKALPVGTTHLRFDPLERLERLAVLTPRPRVNLILYYGVLAPRAAWRSAMVVATADGVDAADGASSGEPDGDASRASRAGAYNQALDLSPGARHAATLWRTSRRHK